MESKCRLGRNGGGALPRRIFLQSAASTLPLLCVASRDLVRAQPPAEESSGRGRPFPGVITRQTQPPNVESPFPRWTAF
jgi:hypothetical protein